MTLFAREKERQKCHKLNDKKHSFFPSTTWCSEKKNCTRFNLSFFHRIVKTQPKFLFEKKKKQIPNHA